MQITDLSTATVRLFPTAEVKAALGRRAEWQDDLKEAALAAIEKAGEGFDLHFMVFDAKGKVFALAARVSENQRLDIEVGVCSPGLTRRVITGETHRRAEQGRQARRAPREVN